MFCVFVGNFNMGDIIFYFCVHFLVKMINAGYTDVIRRYNDKVANYSDGINPFDLDIKKCKDPLPTNLAYYDVVNYCIEKDSAYTFASFRAYKALDAYKFYESGWIREIGCRKITDGTVVIAMVRHLRLIEF